ncbi:MAG: DNA gyrase subunit A [Phycisphaerales bacterium]|nr:DNA gyrase subunit A [Phycisphaerales bacterium]
MPDETPPNPPPADAAHPGSPAPGGQVLDLQIEDELKDSYLTYAMSTIMDRALPDVRDGLKPSQRRILVAMNDLGLRPNRKHIKCAKICGDTSGNYHPHGESVIYPTLVGLAQPWKMRTALVDPQGNFGSIDPDPPAAMRYTEARLAHAAIDMLADLNLGTVDFQPNYDDRLKEPTVLPGKFPHLLINGGVGIAVGMATSLLPHNPGEIFRAITALIDNPDITLNELLAIVPGPDFPTGGVICGRAGIIEGYSSGRGKLVVRGAVHIEPIPGSKDRQQLVIDTIPYQLGQRTLVERIADAVNDDKIKDISDVRNESGRDAQTRIVCELKRGADPAVVENQLYQFTPLQDTLSIMNIALVNRQPRTLSLKELLRCYVDHRIDVIERRTRFLLHEAQKRAHVLEGLIYAVCDIDEVIRIIRACKTREEAISRLAARRFTIAPSHPQAPKIPARLMAAVRAGDPAGGVLLTRVQAEAIGAMRLIQLVGLEIDKLVSDYRKLVDEIEGYEAILADRKLVLGIIKADCAEMAARYDSPRRTRIEEAETDINIEALIQEHDCAVTISHAGWVKRTPLSTYREQNRGGRGIIAADANENDFIEHILVASTHDDLLVFTDQGRIYKIKVYEIPEMGRTSKGRSIVNLVDLRPGEAEAEGRPAVRGERAVSFLPIADFERGEDYLVFATAQGKVKRSSLKLYQNVNKAGIIAIDLNDGDSLIGVVSTSGNDHVLLATAGGMSIRFKESDARAMGRNAAGVKGIELEETDRVVGVVRVEMRDESDAASSVHPEVDLLTVTENGYGKRTDMAEYLVHGEGEGGREELRIQSRGGKGRIDIRTTERNGRVVTVKAVKPDEGVVFVTQSGMLVRTAVAGISRIGRNTQGVRVVNLKDGDKLIAAAVTPPGGDEEPAPQPDPQPDHHTASPPPQA